MPEYRAYRIGMDGHFVSSTPLVCADDADAIGQAQRLCHGGHSVEIWRADRLIAQLPGTNHPPPP
jgi:hypothetical protein